MSILEHQLCTELAKAKGHYDINLCLALIDKGADPNATNEHGSPVLTLAASKGLTNVAKALIEKGAHVNFHDRQECTALHHAALQGYNDVILLLIDQGADLDAINTHHETALMLAAGSGYIRAVQILCDAGANIHHKDNLRYSALTYAAKYHHIQCAKILIKNGPTGTEGREDAYSALEYAAQYGYADIIKDLLDSGLKPNPDHLVMAASSNKAKAVKVFLDNGIPVNARDSNNSTPLMAAAWGCAAETVEYLIKQGADPSLIEKNGTTAKDIAADKIKYTAGRKKEACEQIIHTLDRALISVFRTAAEAGTSKKHRIHRPVHGR